VRVPHRSVSCEGWGTTTLIDAAAGQGIANAPEHAKGAPGLAFETWGPPSRSPLPSDNCRAILTGSLIIEDNDAPDRMTVFVVPVATWSGGVSDSMMGIDLNL
jgi:hypothetical protein